PVCAGKDGAGPDGRVRPAPADLLLPHLLTGRGVEGLQVLALGGARAAVLALGIRRAAAMGVVATDAGACGGVQPGEDAAVGICDGAVEEAEARESRAHGRRTDDVRPCDHPGRL